MEYLRVSSIRQSISRKGNCHDNALAENLFSHIKAEMFYREYSNIESIDDLKRKIEEYISHYNERPIQVRLGGMTPAAYLNDASHLALRTVQ